MKRLRRPTMPHDVASKVVGRADALCEALLPASHCTGTAEVLHHRHLRSQGGKDTPSNLVHICTRCHDWIHNNPKDAAALGLIITRGRPSEKTKILRRSRWVTLADDGEITPAGASEKASVVDQIDWGETTKWQL
ncbi:HNH endonuclease [Corynebacterium diphtheriae]|uniref:HNH endonuclease n=1 Tax=Corynebacterium diphtheriae TaxID=1717 RepID=UPI0013C7BD08|nr:HNH endonuclease [Corynebacterium diphtheriae]